MVLFLWDIQVICLLFGYFGTCLQYICWMYFSYYFSYLFVFYLGTEVVKPYTPVLPFLPLDFKEPSCHDGAHIYLMIKIYSCGPFTQALEHLQVGKYILRFFVFGFAAIALLLRVHCLGMVMFLLFIYLHIGTYF